MFSDHARRSSHYSGEDVAESFNSQIYAATPHSAWSGVLFCQNQLDTHGPVPVVHYQFLILNEYI